MTEEYRFDDDTRARNDEVLDVIMARDPVEALRSRCEQLAHCGHACTITFTDFQLAKYREEYLAREVDQCLRKIKKLEQYIFIADWSVTGRFHFHGMVQVKDLRVLQYLKSRLQRKGLAGIIKHKLIDNLPLWIEYMLKQYTPEGKNGVICKVKKIITMIK